MDWIYSGPFRAASFLPALVAFPASRHGFWGYFWFAAIEGSAFVGFSFLLPQEFHPAVYPLVAILVWRSVLELTSPGMVAEEIEGARLAQRGIR